MLPMIIHNQPFHPLQTGKKQPESSLKKLKQLLINKKASHQTEISIYIILLYGFKYIGGFIPIKQHIRYIRDDKKEKNNI